MATLTTSALRRLWDRIACRKAGNVFLAAYAALDACLQAHSYAPRQKDTGAYSCRKITGGTGLSLHSYGPGDSFTFWNKLKIATALALDLNWLTNPYQYPAQWKASGVRTDMPQAMVDAIKRIRTRNGQQVWRWGGDYTTNKDTMHFEIVCSPADLATGIDPATVPGGNPHDDQGVPAYAGKPLFLHSTGIEVTKFKIMATVLGYRGFTMTKTGISVFGVGTRNMVRRFQRNNGLTVDGVVGQQTWDKARAKVIDQRRRAGLGA